MECAEILRDEDYMMGYNGDDILCHCMSIKRNEVSQLINNSDNNVKLDEIIDRSGVGSVCMGCHPLIEEMMGQAVWTPVKVSSVIDASESAKTFRFEASGNEFHPAKAGQHILLQAYVNGVWELRRYTLTTAADTTSHREIIVKQVPTGKVSNWLHTISGSDCLIRISQPLGTVTPNLKSEKRLVCLVGGIGITPAIAFVRSANKCVEDSRPIVIDHSVLNEESLILKNQLDQLQTENSKVNITYRLTKENGQLCQQVISGIIKDYPESEFYVCGPPGYSKAILKYLEFAGVDKNLISIEHFSSPEEKTVKQSSNYFYIGILLFLAFLVQDLFQFKMPWLENLQSIESYKIYSGLVFVIYTVGQFILPYNKSCEIPHATSTRYKNHKFRGAFAPLIFFMHSTHFGVAYIFALSTVYLGNFLLGLFNHERISNQLLRITYFKIWLPLHILMSVLTVAMIGFHIYVVASY
jgi:ferredoxin-NADP reductase